MKKDGTENLPEVQQTVKDAVVPHGTQGSHVENRADLGAPASNVALASILSTIAIERSDSCQRGRLRIGQGAEFGHEGNQGGGAEAANALDLLEPEEPLRGYRWSSWPECV